MSGSNTGTCYISLRDRYDYYKDNNFISKDVTFTQFTASINRYNGNNMLAVISVKVVGG